MTVAYVLAIVVAYAVTRAAPVEWSSLAKIAVADLAATIVVFVFSFALDNTSVYDPYWSVAPIVIAAWLALVPGAGRGLDLRQLVVLGAVGLYAVRLTANWVRGWPGLGHEDWRYVAFRKHGKWYWPISFAGLHFFPTVMVFLGCMPLDAALTGPGGFGVLDVLGALAVVGGTMLELVADEQLRGFRKAKTVDGAICDVGVWKWSRHPNYFGELTVWFGLWVFGISANAPWWAAIGWIAMVGLFVGASIPMSEKRSLARRPQYAEHQQRVSMLIPLPPKKT